MAKQENIERKDNAPKKTVYKETEERINENKSGNGKISSVADLGRTDLISRPERKHKPLGSSHEPGTVPGSDI
ncbi:hypothetical protein QG516_00640 [Pedobacter gandavensis]|uniref:hypothetical protein n=1 Tax=Pedobacter gandavensis TaxID=2679963 RepID=UPI00247B082A|nr:hypothetical protein [Pedobacter gandavensis]WGQ10161.1 hypothetical protein QG516_00640 [Pedobacter gandavensis]